MALDLERIMLLLQKRLNGMQEMKRLTGELLESASRNDQVSLELILQMRADEMARIEAAGGTDMASWPNRGRRKQGRLRWLMSQEFLRTGEPKGFEERKILEIRSKTASLLKEVREADQRLNQHIGGRRSYYASNK